MSINVGVLVSYGYLSCILRGLIYRPSSIKLDFGKFCLTQHIHAFSIFRGRTSCAICACGRHARSFPFEMYGLVSDWL